MKAVILAGGLGTRISEETHLKPKPMIEIGGKPVLWHIMKMYSGPSQKSRHLKSLKYAFTLGNEHVKLHQSPKEARMH